MKRKIFGVLLVILCMTCILTFASCGCFKNDEEIKEETPTSTPISSVKGIKFSQEEGRITWNPVIGASQYRVSINGGAEVTVTGTFYEYNPGNNSFSVKIVAVPEDIVNYTNSSASIKTFTFLGQVQNIRMEDGIVRWDAVNGAEAYEVFLNGTSQGIVNGTSFDRISPNTAYKVTVVAKKNDNSQIGSFGNESNVFDGLVIERPVLRFENSTQMIFWNAVDGAEGYKLYISLNGREIVAETFGSSTTSYSNQFIEAGTYKVRVQSTSDKSRTDYYDSSFAEIEIVRLPTVENVKTSYPAYESNGTVYIEFNDIPGAVRFEITEGQIRLNERTKTSFEYTFERSIYEVTKEFYIYTKGDGDKILDSYTGTKFTLTKLAMPQNIKVNNNLMVWDSVSKNTGYKILIDGQVFDADANQLELPPIQGGVHKVQIAAIGNGETIVTSDFCNEIQIIKLIQPQNLHISNNVLYWENVQYCESYLVQIGDLEQEVRTNSFAIDDSYIGEKTTIKVYAIGSGDHMISSNYSETVPLFRLSSPKDFKTDNDKITWSKVENADHYLLYFNYKEYKVTGESFSWDNITTSGDYLIRVVAVGDGSRYFTSSSSTELNVKKLDAPNVFVSANDGFTWGKISMVYQYEVLFNGEVISIDRTKSNYKPTFNSAGEKILQFRALGDGVSTVASSWVEIKHIVEQENSAGSFSVTKNESVFTITVNNPISGKIYLFNISGIVKEGEVSQTVTIANAGSFNVSVATKGDGFYKVDSAYSKVETYEIFNSISSNDIRLSDEGDDYYNIVWKGVPNASGYTLKIVKTRDDGTVEEEIVRDKSSAQTNHGIDMKGYKSVKVTLIVKGDQVRYFDSSETTKTFAMM